MSRRSRRGGITATLILLAVAIGTPVVVAAPPAESLPGICAARSNDTQKKLAECVTLEGVREHQAALQAIADANGGTRAANTPGYDASVAYVVDQLEAAGYNVTLDAFDVILPPDALLEQLTPIAATYETGAFTGTGYGDVAASVFPADIDLVTPATASSGCDGLFTEAFVGAPIVPDPAGPDDFAGMPAGSIALLQRGTCSFGLKAINAEAAGAAAVIIFNQGTADRLGLIVGTLGGPSIVDIPVVGASFANGVALSQPGSTAHVQVDTPVIVSQDNVIAESQRGDPNNIVMAGGHLDSVSAGPGINDNGSGSAVLLEVAEQMAKVNTRNKLRFAWWGAEELSLVGSTAYVASLSAAERDKIALYLNFDMVGSPNHVFFIYDGDNSDGVGSPAGPPGSAEIEKTFEGFYAGRGIPFKGTDFSGRSDYGPFIVVGIPSGGLFTGAEGIKTAAEVTLWGGTAGQQYDPCYHLACDTFANNNNFALDTNSDAVAHATLQYAMNTSDVNGLKGRGDFKPPKSEPEPEAAS